MFYEGKRIIKISGNENAHKYSWWYENLIGNEFQVLSYSAISEDYLVQYNGEFRILPEKDVEVISDTSVPINASSSDRLIQKWVNHDSVEKPQKNPVTKPKKKNKSKKSGKKGKRGNGEGTIYERKPGQWAAVITDGRNPLTGKPVRKFVYGKSYQEVSDKLLDIRSKKKEGTYADPGKLTFGEWLTIWLEDYMKNSLRQTTYESYVVQVKKHIEPSLGNIKLKDLDTPDLQRLYNAKLKAGRADKCKNEKGELVIRKGGLSPRSVRYIHQVIKGALSQAVLEKKLITNPADAVKLPRNVKKEMKILKKEDIPSFLETAKQYRYYAAYLLDLATGLRRGELLALRRGDFKYVQKIVNGQKVYEGSLKITRHLVRVKGGCVFQEPKTENSERTVTVPHEAVVILLRHLATQDVEILAAGEAFENRHNEEDILLFCTPLGKPLDPKNFTRDFQGCLKKAGLEKIRLHDLRHTYATTLLEAGVPLNAVQDQLGHHSPTFTAEQYGHVTKKMKKDAANVMGSILKEATTKQVTAAQN